MDKQSEKQILMDRSHQKSLKQKGVFFSLHFSILLFCAWLLYFKGLSNITEFTGQNFSFSNSWRGQLLFSCSSLYFVRHAITLFYLLHRKITWSEALGLTAFIALFEIAFLLIGGGVFGETNTNFTLFDSIAILLLFTGSFLNTYSEIQRKWWKANSANKGHCYTLGLFKYSMHINFFGDVVLFSGWALLTSVYWTLLLPLLMLSMFIFFHIPDLDRYLAQRYGQEFQEYAQKTKKLIPFIY